MNNQTHFHVSKEPARNSGYCHFHLKLEFVGVCPLCLNERLLLLASLKQKHYLNHRAQLPSTRGHSFSLTTKILSLGSILNRLELRSQKNYSSEFSCEHDCNSSDTSQEDSFISIKFEENGVAFWDKKESIKEINEDSSDQQHGKKQSSPRKGTIRWRKQIGLIFNSIKRSTTANKN